MTDGNNLPKAEQEGIPEARKKNTERLQELANTDLDNITVDELSEREYGRKFRLAYKKIRKAAVVINAKRQLKQVSNEDAYSMLVDICYKIADDSPFN